MPASYQKFNLFGSAARTAVGRHEVLSPGSYHVAGNTATFSVVRSLTIASVVVNFQFTSANAAMASTGGSGAVEATSATAGVSAS
jgi:hypothetical protein